MSATETDKLVRQLAVGFETLQDEYRALYTQHLALERKLATAREQYNELAKLYGSSAATTPPLSLSSSPGRAYQEAEAPNVEGVLQRVSLDDTEDKIHKVRQASAASRLLQERLDPLRKSADGVKIWSEPSVGRSHSRTRTMPSISESPLEQDFTIEGRPSKLGCPFASMANKKLSSHAASVLGRLNPGSVATSTPRSSVSRVDGRESFSRRGERRSSMLDPIKAEICGLSDHDDASPHSERAAKEHREQQDTAEAGVCPIRFLDQHSPEEVATYFEKHKHELPRSHETCVKRYQSNEQSIRELDAKYDSMVAMIQGLGAKHKNFLPAEPEDEDAIEDADAKSDEKIQKWASSVSAQAADPREDAEDEERQPHFERSLPDIRVGESPSRPWGIHVPNEALGKKESQISTRPAHAGPAPSDSSAKASNAAAEAAKCPFSTTRIRPTDDTAEADSQRRAKPQPAFINPDKDTLTDDDLPHPIKHLSPGIVINGPVFIGYTAKDAEKILEGIKITSK